MVSNSSEVCEVQGEQQRELCFLDSTAPNPNGPGKFHLMIIDPLVPEGRVNHSPQNWCGVVLMVLGVNPDRNPLFFTIEDSPPNAKKSWG